MSASLNSILQTQGKIKVVDIGASPFDHEPPYAAAVRAGDAHVVGFEPNSEALAEWPEPDFLDRRDLLRDFARLDLMTTDPLSKLALILNDCYGSFDLVAHLLTEYDKRMHTPHSQTFLVEGRRITPAQP